MKPKKEINKTVRWDNDLLMRIDKILKRERESFSDFLRRSTLKEVVRLERRYDA